MKPLSTSLWLVLVAGMSTQQLTAQNATQHEPFISRDCLWYADQSIEQMLKLTPDQITALNDIRKRYPQKFQQPPNVPKDAPASKKVPDDAADQRVQPQYDAQGRQIPSSQAADKPAVDQQQYDQMDNTENPPPGSSDGAPDPPATEGRTNGTDAALQMELRKAIPIEKLQEWKTLCDGQYEKDQKMKRHPSIR